MALSCPFSAAAGAAAAAAGTTVAGTNTFRGPPLPLVLVPLVVQLVRASRDPNLTAYLARIIAQGSAEVGGVPAAIAANAHVLAQYALSKVPAQVLYWFTARVLNLPGDVATQTVEFLKESGSRLDRDGGTGTGTRTELEMACGEKSLRVPHAMMMVEGPPAEAQLAQSVTEMPTGGGPRSDIAWKNVDVAVDIESRLERLEAQYRTLLQERRSQASLSSPFSSSSLSSTSPSVRAVGYGVDDSFVIPQQLLDPIAENTIDTSMQLVHVNGDGAVDARPTTTATTAIPEASLSSNAFEASSTPQLQEIGLRLGRIFLEWAGDTMKQSLVAAAAKSNANKAVVGAGVDLAGRVVDAIVT
ncbi:hypothetical protein BD289DRAFT_297255 [Coniella lustricola]|uniref:Uncharacterized protein n=1 Tax=Coniella lustricola TaxID=2025994 RepID=A0A2T3A4Q2_9PEZI|nr:hypothetical protein BD289DRAFT_297255 [Coniella lustricola]